MAFKDQYKPYTYLIGWSKQNKWYYGSETKNSKRGVANPNNLWKTYFTSSKYVKEFREIFGDPDVIEIRKVFDCNKKCSLWEHKVLTRMNVVGENKWLNKSNGYLFDPECTRRAMIGNSYRLGKKLSESHIEAIRKSNTGNKHTLGRSFVMDENTKKKISYANKGKPKPHHLKEILQKRCRDRNKTPWNKGRNNPKMKGTKFYNNGIDQKMFYPGSEPLNWVVGRIKSAVRGS